jgi:alanine dehydrogenase
MDIVLLRENPRGLRRERRVALLPDAVAALARAGHRVYVEAGAGQAAGHGDGAYADAGASVVARRGEAAQRGQVVLSLDWPEPAELAAMRSGAVVVSLHGFGRASAAQQAAAREAGVSVVGAESLRDGAGRAIVRHRMSEIAGALVPQLAGRLLESRAEGRPGVMLAPLPGQPPANAVILGAGSLGAQAARSLAGLGVSVHLLDVDAARLDAVAPGLPAHVSTAMATREQVQRALRFANVLVLAVRDAAGQAPRLLQADDVASMREGAVLIDFSIDLGGASATSRPIADPEDAYAAYGVVHLTMPNTPSLVARAASRRLSDALLPFVAALAEGAPLHAAPFAAAVHAPGGPA